MDRVLVTGGAGFLGNYVVQALLARGLYVMSFDCLLPQVHPTQMWPEYQPDHDRLTKYFGDVRRFPNVFQSALDEFRPDTIIHLAAAVGVGQSAYEPAHYTSANVTGTVAVVDWILKWNRAQDEVEAGLAELDRTDDIEPQDGETPEAALARVQESIAPMREALIEQRRPRVQRLFVAGSMSSYGEGAYVSSGPVPVDLPADHPDAIPAPTDEGKAFTPASIYAWSKAEAERAALMLGRQHGLDVRVGRFFNAYGRHQALSNPYTGVGAIFAARIHAGLAPIVYEDGLQSRDFIHASDVAEGVLTILERGAAGEVYNVGTGRATSVVELACLISLAGRPPVPTDGSARYQPGHVVRLASGGPEMVVQEELERLDDTRRYLCAWSGPPPEGAPEPAADTDTDTDTDNAPRGLALNTHEFIEPVLVPVALTPLVTGMRRVGDTRHCFSDSSKLRALGWEPKVPLESGVVELMEWVGSQHTESRELLNRAHAELVSLGLVK